MKIQLPDDIAKQLREPLARCRDTSPNGILAGQVMRSSWEDGGADKLFLFLAVISPATSRKIRKLIEKERDRAAS